MKDPRQYCGWCAAHSDVKPEYHEKHCPRYPRRESGAFWWALLAVVLLWVVLPTLLVWERLQ